MPNLPDLRESARCPHCSVHFNEIWRGIDVGTDPLTSWLFRYTKCPDCQKSIFMLRKYEPRGKSGLEYSDIMAWPKLALGLLHPRSPRISRETFMKRH